uniref:Uncharacterized protein n=1 Tax=Anopheles atroparvus TaxID=41427 RepID=A0A182JME5_ANOAO
MLPAEIAATSQKARAPHEDIYLTEAQHLRVVRKGGGVGSAVWDMAVSSGPLVAAASSSKSHASASCFPAGGGGSVAVAVDECPGPTVAERDEEDVFDGSFATAGGRDAFSSSVEPPGDASRRLEHMASRMLPRASTPCICSLSRWSPVRGAAASGARSCSGLSKLISVRSPPPSSPCAGGGAVSASSSSSTPVGNSGSSSGASGSCGGGGGSPKSTTAHRVPLSGATFTSGTTSSSGCPRPSASISSPNSSRSSIFSASSGGRSCCGSVAATTTTSASSSSASSATRRLPRSAASCCSFPARLPAVPFLPPGVGSFFAFGGVGRSLRRSAFCCCCCCSLPSPSPAGGSSTLTNFSQATEGGFLSTGGFNAPPLAALRSCCCSCCCAGLLFARCCCTVAVWCGFTRLVPPKYGRCFSSMTGTMRSRPMRDAGWLMGRGSKPPVACGTPPVRSSDEPRYGSPHSCMKSSEPRLSGPPAPLPPAPPIPPPPLIVVTVPSGLTTLAILRMSRRRRRMMLLLLLPCCGEEVQPR